MEACFYNYVTITILSVLLDLTVQLPKRNSSVYKRKNAVKP